MEVSRKLSQTPQAIKRRLWRQQNPEKYLEQRRNYYAKNKERIAKYQKSKRYFYMDKWSWYRKKHYDIYPWRKTLHSIVSRCSQKKGHYASNGIKNFLTEPEIKELWFRDGAEKMKKPTIDRLDFLKNYTFENCRFAEHSDNSRWKYCARCKELLFKNKTA